LGDWRLVDVELDAGVELDAAEWRSAPMEKAVGAMENTVAGGWPDGEKGWWAAALERGGERGRRSVGRGGERHGGVVALEHAHGGERRGGVVTLEPTRLCRRDGGAVNGEERQQAHE
jgi:hypothetical protein